MPATYDPALPTDSDWVRFLAGDRDTAKAKLQDEEIAALLVEEANKYLAAARACEIIVNRNGGVTHKWVGDLRLSFSDTPDNAYNRYVKELRARGAFLTTPKPRVFKTFC